MVDPNVFRRFATERFKRVKHLTSPLIDIAVFLALAIGFTIGLFTFELAFNLAALYLYIFIPNTLAVLAGKAINNLINERKQTKAWVMLLTIAASLLLGGLLGYFVLSKSALFVDFVCVGGLSPILIASLILGGNIFKKHLDDTRFNFIGPIMILTGWLVPVSAVPLMLDVVFVSAVSVAFVSSLIAKQALRLYYYYHYGHTNADGYEKNRSQTDQEEFMTQQAQFFKVSTKEFKALVDECEKEIFLAKNRQVDNYDFPCIPVTKEESANSFKDIYFALMRPPSGKPLIELFNRQSLLSKSTKSSIQNRFNSATSIFRTRITHKQLGEDLDIRLQDVDLYTEDYHQPNVAPGLPDHLIKPFTKTLRA